MKRAEQVLGLVLLLLAIYLAYECTQIDAGASGASSGMGAGFMPFWLSVGLGISAAALLLRAVVLPAVRFEPAFFTGHSATMRVICILAGYLVAVVALKPLGMLISLAIVMATTMPVFGSRSWKAITLASIATPLFVYLVFGRWLHVDLPMGILENIISIY